MGRTYWRIKGKKSGLELQVGSLLILAGFAEGYEKDTLKYVTPESHHRYTPDFKPSSDPIYLETKGQFTTEDRKKMLLVVAQHPDKIFIMVFGRALHTITKKSKTTYGMWCDKNNILWCDLKDFKLDPKACLLSLIIKQKSGLSKQPPRQSLKKSSKLVKPASLKV
jgi:Phage endonuclease I